MSGMYFNPEKKKRTFMFLIVNSTHLVIKEEAAAKDKAARERCSSVSLEW